MKWKWTLLRAGAFKLDGGAMFGIIPKPLWTRLVTPDGRNRITLQTNCVLLEGEDGRFVLIEAGLGDKIQDKRRDLYDMEDRCIIDALADVGRTPEDISTVILSHLHFDHAAGLTRRLREGESGVGGHDVALTFPKAEIVVQKREWEDALANRSTMHSTYLPDHLQPVAERVRLVDGADDVLPGVWVDPVPGHTWGQQAVIFQADDGATVAFPGDLIPTVHHAQSTFGMAYDVESYTTMQRKHEFLTHAHREGWTLALDHEPGPAVHRVEARDDRPGEYRLVPVG